MMRLQELEKQLTEAQASLQDAENKKTDAADRYQLAVDAGDLEQAREHRAVMDTAESDVAMFKDRISSLESKRTQAQKLEARPLFEKAAERYEQARQAEQQANAEFVALVDQLQDLQERMKSIHSEARFSAIRYRESAVLAGEDDTLPKRACVDGQKVQALFRLAREYSNLFNYRNSQAGQVSSMKIKPRDFNTGLARVANSV